MTFLRSDQSSEDGDRGVVSGNVAAFAAAPFEPARVLLVAEAGSATDRTVAGALRTAGHRVVSVPGGDSAEEAWADGEHDLILLDLGRGGGRGLDLLRRVRLTGDAPVIVLSDLGAIEERIEAFDLGCDDYLQAPIEAAELSRRIRAVLRRRGARSTQHIVGPAGLKMRIPEHTVCVGDHAVNLTPKEFALLRILLESRDQVISPDELSTKIWGYETFGSRNFVEAHVSRLRAKLAEAGAPEVVATVRGVGYVVR